MNKKLKCLSICLFLFSLIGIKSINAQCENVLTHISGTEIIGSIAVNVTSTSFTTITEGFCLEAEPYTVGRDSNSNNGVGSYTFEFSPAIDSLSLSFSAINNNESHKEIISIFINGEHYFVTESTTDSLCDRPPAIVNDSGDITGALNGASSGWKDLTLAGPITSITVQDSVVLGMANGVSFSISICNEFIISTLEIEDAKFNLFPNPANDIITISGLNQKEINYSIYDVFGNMILKNTSSQLDFLEIDVSNFQTGLYFVFLERNGMIEKKKVMIE